MHSVPCTFCCARCILYCVFCTVSYVSINVCFVLCPMYFVLYVTHYVLCIMCYVLCTVNHILRSMYHVPCAFRFVLFTMRFVLCTVYYPLCTKCIEQIWWGCGLLRSQARQASVKQLQQCLAELIKTHQLSVFMGIDKQHLCTAAPIFVAGWVIFLCAYQLSNGNSDAFKHTNGTRQADLSFLSLQHQ